MPQPLMAFWARVLAEALSKLLLGAVGTHRCNKYPHCKRGWQPSVSVQRCQAACWQWGPCQCGLYLPDGDQRWKQTFPLADQECGCGLGHGAGALIRS